MIEAYFDEQDNEKVELHLTSEQAEILKTVIGQELEQCGFGGNHPEHWKEPLMDIFWQLDTDN
ncbi:MAG: hypothetical protein Q4B26_14135 [Eubacteriales bacterium]|nr:hypothetical protein [Eubacteriales bacterium]